MHIVEEQRTTNLLRFLVFLVSALAVLGELALHPQSVSSGLWLPILLVLFAALSYFSFQSIFYKRDISIEQGRVRVVTFEWRNKHSAWELPVGDFEKLSLRWYFPSRFFPSSRLRLILEHKDPAKTLVLSENKSNEPVDVMRAAAQKIFVQIGANTFFDESDRVE